MAPLDAARTAWRGVLRASATARYRLTTTSTPSHRARTWARRSAGYRAPRERRRYEELAGEELDRYEDDPQLRDWTATSPFDPHYTYQDAWAAREIHAHAPARHVDVGSRI